MTDPANTPTELKAEVAGLSVRVLEGGNGRPLVALHHSTGNVGWSRMHARLSQQFRVLAVDMPGYGQSERPEWAREPRDIAILVNRLLDKLGLQDVVLVGAGLGGFVAVEMATMSECRLGQLVLIGAAGLKPDDGEILDQMMLDFDEYVRAGFVDETKYLELFGEDVSSEVRQLWDFSREMTARITWKPYMFSRKLKPLLADVNVPTLIVWGSEDRVVPLDCARQYAAAIPFSRLELVDGAGHLVELERPDAVASLIGDFIAAAPPPNREKD